MKPRSVFANLAVQILLAATLAITGAAQSQSTTGVIRGRVVDQDGAPIQATIVMRETRTNFTRSIATNDNGTFTAALLPVGVYDVAVRAVGFQEARRSIALRVGQTAVLEMTLGAAVQLQAIAADVIAPTIDPTRSEASTRLAEDAVEGLPNNGRNFLSLTLLTPNVAIVQGPDGDELSIAGQRGIHNNISVDGADFNNPFFGEQRGGQRPAFTFNLDAVEEIVVISQGANAEFGRSSGGFVNVITKSGTNSLSGSVHYFGQFDALSATATHTNPDGSVLSREPNFSQHQFGFTLGGPLIRDKAFFFVAYDQQVFDDTKQEDPNRISDASLRAWMDTAFGGALAGDFGPIERTNNARALLAKIDWNLSEQHRFSLKYNYTWSQQENGTFDVDVWGRSANALEKDFSHAINGQLSSVLGPNMTNEFRFQLAREDRPRPYGGPTSPLLGTTGTFPNGRPFPDTAMDFANGFRFGMPFFIPVDAHDTRIQVLNNLSIASGDHLFKIGAEWNRTEASQTFIGFAHGRFIFSSVNGFLNYVANGNGYVECSDGSSSTTGACPAGTSIVGPVLLYLQQAGVSPLSVEESGTQDIPQHELAFFVQDSWRASNSLTLNYGLRWEAQIQPKPITPASEVFYAPLIGTTQNGQRFPSDGEVPSDWNMFQPRLGIVYDANGEGQTVLRGSAGIYYARIPGLNLASSRSTNGSRGQTIFRNSTLTFLGRPPNYDELLPQPAGTPFFPDVFVFDENFQNPRTISATVGIEQFLAEGISGSVSYTHASTDNLTRFVNRNDAALGSPWSSGLPNGNGINQLVTVESTARSRYNGITVGLQRTSDPDVNFQINYTLSWDKSDDDNERDPFSFRYADVTNFAPEYNWSDRDQRHRVNGWILARLPADFIANGRVSFYSAQPVSENCVAGGRAVTPADRICADGSILPRNTLRKENEFFSLDIRLSRAVRFGQGELELIGEVFNVTNADNFLDASSAGLLFNFDGTLRSGLGNPRQFQVGAKYRF